MVTLTRLRSLSGALVALALLAVAAGCSSRGDDPVSATPGPLRPGEPALHAVRLDLAGRLKAEPLSLELVEVRHAGWDGCLGVIEPNKACTQIFLGGVIARFHQGDRFFRYHLGGGRFIATDFLPGKPRIEDGSPVPPEIAADLNALLAGYARGDLALRTRGDVEQVSTTAITPVDFPDTCLGFLPDGGAACAERVVAGAVVILKAGGKDYRYHVGDVGVVATDFEKGSITMPSTTPGTPGAPAARQEDLRRDLARRLGKPIDQISVHSYEQVEWPNGCIGVVRPNQLCIQVITPGFLAYLTDGDKLYRYHGSALGGFVALDFEPGVRAEEPFR